MFRVCVAVTLNKFFHVISMKITTHLDGEQSSETVTYVTSAERKLGP